MKYQKVEQVEPNPILLQLHSIVHANYRHNSLFTQNECKKRHHFEKKGIRLMLFTSQTKHKQSSLAIFKANRFCFHVALVRCDHSFKQ